MSCRVAPPRKVHGWVRSATRMKWPQSSRSVGAERPSPRPSSPWQRAQPICDVGLGTLRGALGRERRRLRQLHRRGVRRRVPPVVGEGLQDLDDVVHLVLGELREGRHAGAGQADADRAVEVRLQRQGAERRAAELVLGGGEVARRRQQAGGRDALPVAGVAVALGAPLVVDLPAVGALLVGAEIGCRRGRGLGGGRRRRQQQRRQPDGGREGEQREHGGGAAHHSPSVSARARGRLPVKS